MITSGFVSHVYLLRFLSVDVSKSWSVIPLKSLADYFYVAWESQLRRADLYDLQQYTCGKFIRRIT